MSHLLKLCAIVSVAAALGGCSNEYPPNLVPAVQSEDEAPELYRPTLDSDYTIGPDDGLLIQSYYDTGLKQQALVRSDGRISLLLVGEVMAAGQTPTQLADELTHLYAKQLDRPDITVSITSSAGMVVYIGGEVTKPAQLPIKGQLTLLQGIDEAGGFLNSANKEQVLILRKTPDGRYRTLQVDVDKVLKNQSSELYLQRHDIVYVPKTQIARVDQFVEQYINSIIPHSITGVFGYQYLRTTAPNVTTTPP
jgi:polysaccharide export outer membrane protein